MFIRPPPCDAESSLGHELVEFAYVGRIGVVQKTCLMSVSNNSRCCCSWCMPDVDYVESRLRIGALHARIGVTPRWYVSSYRLYEKYLFPMQQLGNPLT